MIAPDDKAVRTELRSGRAVMANDCPGIDGHVELNVKGVHAEEALLRDVLLQNDQLRVRNRALRAAGGGDHQDRVAFGEQVAAAVAERSARTRARSSPACNHMPHRCAGARRSTGASSTCRSWWASGARPDFDGALSRLRGELPGYASVGLYGPLPPYSFVGNEAEM